jgi:hypothetical protein
MDPTNTNTNTAAAAASGSATRIDDGMMTDATSHAKKAPASTIKKQATAAAATARVVKPKTVTVTTASKSSVGLRAPAAPVVASDSEEKDDANMVDVAAAANSSSALAMLDDPLLVVATTTTTTTATATVVDERRMCMTLADATLILIYQRCGVENLTRPSAVPRCAEHDCTVPSVSLDAMVKQHAETVQVLQNAPSGRMFVASTLVEIARTWMWVRSCCPGADTILQFIKHLQDLNKNA